MAALMLGPGCSEKRAPDAGTPQAHADAVAARCARHLPPAVREQLLPGWAELTTPRFESVDPEGLTVCAFRSDAGSLTLAFDCRHSPSDGQLERTREALLAQEGTDVPGVGRAAVRAVAGPDSEQLTAWDTDSPCSITTTWLGEGREQAVELTRQLLQFAGSDAGVAPAPVATDALDGGGLGALPDAG